MRQCKKCQILKPLLEFTPSKNCKEGFTYTCKVCRQSQRNQWRKENPIKHYADWRKKNPEQANQIVKDFYKRNPKYCKRYKLRPTKRQPIWADVIKIQEIYKNCPEGHHVDHIIPLRGKLVSGLHVPENLQYLPAKENISKGNKYAVL